MGQMDQKEFTQRWVKDLIDSMDAHLDEQTKKRVLESCGRACARSGPVHAAKEHQGDLEGWLATLAKWHGGEEYVQRRGDAVYVICTECVCPVVKDMQGVLSDTYCDCSLGWMKETFETVVGKPVDVDLYESVKRGAQRCRFAIHV